MQDSFGSPVALRSPAILPQPHPFVDSISGIRSSWHRQCISICGLGRCVALHSWHHLACPGSWLHGGTGAASIPHGRKESKVPPSKSKLYLSSTVPCWDTKCRQELCKVSDYDVSDTFYARISGDSTDLPWYDSWEFRSDLGWSTALHKIFIT